MYILIPAQFQKCFPANKSSFFSSLFYLTSYSQKMWCFVNCRTEIKSYDELQNFFCSSVFSFSSSRVLSNVTPVTSQFNSVYMNRSIEIKVPKCLKRGACLNAGWVRTIALSILKAQPMAAIWHFSCLNFYFHGFTHVTELKSRFVLSLMFAKKITLKTFCQSFSKARFVKVLSTGLRIPLTLWSSHCLSGQHSSATKTQEC